MQEKASVPAIRFAGFTDDWEQRKLGEVIKAEPFKQYLKEPEIDGKYEVVQQGDTPILGYANGNPFQDYGNVVLFGDHTLSLFKPEMPFFVATDGIRIVSSIKKMDRDYLHCLLERYKPKSEGYKRYYSILTDCGCTLTNGISEQRQIGTFFRHLVHLITLHQRKFSRLYNIKKSMLERMFPREGATVPEIRFAGFTDAWEQRKLGDFADFYNGDRSSRYPKDSELVTEGVPFINAGDLVNGRVKLDTANRITKAKYEELSGAKIRLGDIIYCLRGTLGKNAFVDNFDFGTVASSLVDIRPKDIDGKYLFHVLNSDIEYRQRVVHDEGAAQPNLSAKNLSEFTIPVPDKQEQERIASFLDDLDHLITLHQRELERLQNIKKSCLEKMFV